MKAMDFEKIPNKVRHYKLSRLKKLSLNKKRAGPYAENVR